MQGRLLTEGAPLFAHGGASHMAAAKCDGDRKRLNG